MSNEELENLREKIDEFASLIERKDETNDYESALQLFQTLKMVLIKHDFLSLSNTKDIPKAFRLLFREILEYGIILSVLIKDETKIKLNIFSLISHSYYNDKEIPQSRSESLIISIKLLEYLSKKDFKNYFIELDIYETNRHSDKPNIFKMFTKETYNAMFEHSIKRLLTLKKMAEEELTPLLSKYMERIIYNSRKDLANDILYSSNDIINIKQMTKLLHYNSNEETIDILKSLGHEVTGNNIIIRKDRNVQRNRSDRIKLIQVMNSAKKYDYSLFFST